MASRDLKVARETYLLRDFQKSKLAHLKRIPEKHKQGDFVKSAVYSSLDGILAIFAITSAAFGSEQSLKTVVILGLSTLVGDALAMAIGDYLGTKSEIEFQKKEREREEWEVENNPEEEKLEMEEIYMKKGFLKEDSKLIVNLLAKNTKAWIDIMMMEELGFAGKTESPFKNGLVSFFCFLLAGVLPLIPYIIVIGFALDITPSQTFYISLGISCLTLFGIGSLKIKLTGKHFILSGLETLIIGGFTGGIALLVGWILQKIIDQLQKHDQAYYYGKNMMFSIGIISLCIILLNYFYK